MLVPAETVTGTNGRGRMCVFLAVNASLLLQSACITDTFSSSRRHTVPAVAVVQRTLGKKQRDDDNQEPARDGCILDTFRR